MSHPTFPASREVQSIPLDRLRPHASNPRPKITPESVDDLVASIQSHGLLAPLVVSGSGQGPYTILAGHRRAVALGVIGEKVAPCVVLGATDDVIGDDAILLADNVHRVDLDPLRVGLLVASAFEHDPSLSVEALARRIGKPVRWVARARSLGELSPTWRKRVANPKDPASRAPIETLVRIASLAEEAQERLAKDIRQEWQFEAHQIGEVLAGEFHLLGAAPWDLDDPAVVTGATACASCPKTSTARPGLFDEPADAGDIRKATCRDGACFAAKMAATVAGRIRKARAEHGKDLVVIRTAPGEGHRQVARGVLDGVKKVGAEVEDSWSLKRAPGKTGTPAYVIAGRDAGKVVRVTSAEESKASKRKAAPSPDAETADQRRARYRAKIVAKLCFAAVEKMPAPPLLAVCGLVALYGAEPEGFEVKPVDVERAVRVTADDEKLRKDLWEAVRGAVAGRFLMETAYTLEATAPERAALAKALGLPVEEFAAKALEEVPEPRKRDAKVKPAPKARAARKPKASKSK